MSRATIRFTVHYESNSIKVYAYDEANGRSIAEVIQCTDPRAKDIEAIKLQLADNIKGVSREKVSRRNSAT